MSVRSLLRTLRSRIEDIGGEVVSLDQRKHIQIRVRFPQGEVKVGCACTPTDETAAANMVMQLVRRKQRALLNA